MKKVILSVVLGLLAFSAFSVSTAEAARPWVRRGYYVNGNYYNPRLSYTVPQYSSGLYYYNGHWYNPAFSYTVPVR
jgi:hypothetical protein